MSRLSFSSKCGAFLYCTWRVKAVVCAVPPPEPVIVMEYVPVLAVLAAVNVSLDEPEPGEAIGLGLKLAVTPLGMPEAESEIADLNPPETDVLTVTYPLRPRLRAPDVGETAMVKFAVTGAVTVSETVVVSIVALDVPVMVIGYVPGVTAEPTVKVAVELPAPIVNDDGLKPTVTPEGFPDADNETLELNPPNTVLVIVEVPALP